MMTDTEQWDRWCLLWRCVGWRALVQKSNYNIDDLLDIFAALMMRIGVLETRHTRSLFGFFL